MSRFSGSSSSPFRTFRLGDIFRVLRYFLGRLIPLVFFSLLSLYFLWCFRHGPRGQEAYQTRLQIQEKAQAALSLAKQEEAVWARRVQGLGHQALDKDLLDERSRRMLNDSTPDEIIIPLPEDKD